ncbi:Zinc finger protein 444 [Frankliniella fusca]|uniref:Zinc finger protein 444 n=1 Tax=Frankliniella fusca TaxID=407009 RepID=A0AAE1I460_9NEOP|nr:Zinc finger protein 444 [Frankliniella fusca]
MTGRFRFEPFRADAERWSNYVSRLEFALEAQGFTTDEQKKTALVSICSAEQYEQAIASYVYTDNPMYPTPVSSVAVPYDKILSALKARYSAFEPSPAVAEDEFLNRRQGPDEPLCAYVAELRRLASFCEFQAGYQGRIKAQLMRGAAHPEARARLLRNPHKRTLEQCITLLQSYEDGDRDMRRTKGAPGGAAWASINLASYSEPELGSAYQPPREPYRGPAASWYREPRATCPSFGPGAEGPPPPDPDEVAPGMDTEGSTVKTKAGLNAFLGV